MPANLENSAVVKGMEKVNFHCNLKKDNAKECLNYHTIVLISHASKVMLKILQARLQQYVNQDFPDGQAGFRKGSNQRSDCEHLLDHRKNQVNSRKTSTSASLTTLKPFLDHKTVETS